MREPKISVIIPVYNGENTIKDCLKSVLKQSYQNYEVIVVDNNSDDKSKETILKLAKKFKKIRYVFEEKRGRGAARNAGIRNCKGEIIASTDCDCVVPTNWLDELTKPIRRDNKQAVQGFEKNNTKNFWSRNIQKADLDFIRRVKRGKYINHIDTKNFAIKANLIKKVMFDPDVVNFDDFDLYLRVKNKTKIYFLPDCLVFHIHENSFLKTVKKQFDRGYWTMQIYKKYQQNKIERPEPMLESVTYKNFISFPFWIFLQFLTKPIADSLFLLITELSWRAGIILSILKFNTYKSEKDKRRSLLVITASDEYYNQAKTVFSSIFWNAGWNGDCMLLPYRINESKLKWFTKRGILVYKYDPLIFNYPELPKKQLICLSKFLLFTPHFKKWKNIVFLDTDVIVYTSLQKLTNIQGIYAAQEPPEAATLKEQFFNSSYNNIKLKRLAKKYNLNKTAFNCGVMAYSTNLIDNDTFDKLIEIFKPLRSILRNPEQGTFNLFFYNRLKRLPLIYNFNVSFWREHKKVLKGMGIIISHFMGNKKPWLKGDPYYEEWQKYFKKAPMIEFFSINKNPKIINKYITIFTSKYLYVLQNFYKNYYKISRFAGLCGTTLKDKNPSLYSFLKKFTN